MKLKKRSYFIYNIFIHHLVYPHFLEQYTISTFSDSNNFARSGRKILGGKKKKKRIRAAKVRLGSRAVIRKSREEVPREERKRRGNDRDTEYACFLFKGFIALSIHPFIRSTRAHPTLQDTSRLSSRVPHAPLLPPLLSRRFFLFSHFPLLPPRPSTALFVADYSFQEFFIRLYFDNIFANE